MALLVAAGAAVGAPLRYAVDRLIRNRSGSLFPWGTMVVNLAASGLLAFLVSLPASATTTALLGAGLCGALSTYSTFSYETLKLLEARAYAYAMLNVVGSIAVCLLAAWCGLMAAHTMT